MEKIRQGDKLQMLSNEEVARTFIVMELEDIERLNATNARLYDIDEKTEQWWMIENHLNIRWKVVERLTPLT